MIPRIGVTTLRTSALEIVSFDLSEFRAAMLTLRRQKITAVSLWPRPEEPTQVGSTDLGGRLEGRRGPPALHGSRRAASQPSLRRLRLLWSSAPHHEAGRVPRFWTQQH